MAQSSVLQFIFISTLFTLSTALTEVKIGGLFKFGDDLQEAAFLHAVEQINSDHSILPSTNLSAYVEQFHDLDSFHACKTVCDMMTTGMAAIFGPPSGEVSEHVQSICDTMEIPHLEMRWHLGQRRESCLVNLYPHPTALAKAFVDIVTAWGWKSFTIIYENSDSLIRMNELLKLEGPNKVEVTLRQLDSGDDYRPLLSKCKENDEVNFIMDCSADRIFDILIQAQQVGLMASYHNYIITSFDLHTVDLDSFKYSGTNITGLRIVDPEDLYVIKSVNGWGVDLTPNHITSQAAMVFDAVHLFAHALHQLHDGHDVDIKGLDCESEITWPHGNSLINYIRVNELTGLTGVVKFDNQGFRTNFVLDITELTMDGLVKVGTWSPSKGVNMTRLYKPPPAREASMFNRTFIVSIAESAPYIMLKEASGQLTGNDRFEGYAIELIEGLSKVLGFNYTFKPVEDGAYGSFNNDTKEWNGMIRELQDGKAHLAITDLTINSERESAVDFTMPFMNLGISILYRKPTKQPPSLLSFMSPFSIEVWIYIMAAYMGVSVLLFLLARCSPDEWNNPYPCIEEPEELENQFTFKNSLWFTIGALMQQGSDIAPTAISTRMVAGIWWFFTLIMVSSYTANLAAFLTIESMSSPIHNVEDLSKQTKIKYGAKSGGSTASFFKSSPNNEIYKRIWNYMETHPEDSPKSNSEGVDRVVAEDGGYAFFMESSSIEYNVERKCTLAQVNGLLDSKGYGIAMPKNSQYRNQLSAEVLKMQERGDLKKLKDKWWKEKKGGGACAAAASGGGAAAELGLANVGGVFVVLIGGVGAASIIACLEFLYKLRKTTKKDRIPFWPEVKAELKFAFKCQGDAKPVRKREESEDDVPDTTNFVPLSPYAAPYSFGGKESKS